MSKEKRFSGGSLESTILALKMKQYDLDSYVICQDPPQKVSCIKVASHIGQRYARLPAENICFCQKIPML